MNHRVQWVDDDMVSDQHRQRYLHCESKKERHYILVHIFAKY